MNHFLKIAVLLYSSFFLFDAQAAEQILIFGDSLSAGYGIARESSWANLLQVELNHHHPYYTVVNASISGETTSGGVRRITKALNEHQPKIVIIELGANDGLRGSPLVDTEKNLREIIEQSHKIKAKVLLLGIQIPPNYGLAYAKQFRELYPALAKHYKVGLVPFMLAGIPADEFQADNLHPNAKAQEQILQNILSALNPML